MKMRTDILGLALFIGSGLCIPQVHADLVSKSTINNGRIVSGYVFQGSRNMKRYKNSRVTSSRSVPAPVFSVTPVESTRMVLPAMQSPANQPKPRFGYGSDYSSQGKASYPATAAPKAKPPSLTQPPQQVYTFQYTRPQTYEYWPVVPYSYGGYGCGNYRGSYFGSSHLHFSQGGFSYHSPRISVRLFR